MPGRRGGGHSVTARAGPRASDHCQSQSLCCQPLSLHGTTPWGERIEAQQHAMPPRLTASLNVLHATMPYDPARFTRDPPVAWPWTTWPGAHTPAARPKGWHGTRC
jgi:hypothetical protein